MKSLLEFIIESVETSSNSERLEQLRQYLKNKKYEDYVDTLNKILEDPKAKALLQDGFDSEFGDLKFKFSVKRIPVTKLMPTQNEIDISKSLNYPFKNPSAIEAYFKNTVALANMPLITLNGEYIIDGHHRWSQAYAYNPNAKMECFDYAAKISPEEMLKAVQGAIAATMAEKGEKIPANFVAKGFNIFDMSKKEISDYIEENGNTETFEELLKFVPKLKDADEAKEYVIDNLLTLKQHNQPDKDAPGRGYMPQTDKAGATDNPQSSKPNVAGSALHKLKTKSVDKQSIK